MLVYIDGFDTYTTANMQLRLASNGGIIDVSGGRTGIQRLATNASGFGASKNTPALATYITGFAMMQTGTVTSPYQFCVIKEGTTAHLIFQYSVSSGILEVFRGSTSFLLGSVSVSIPKNIWIYVEIRATIHDTLGAIEIRLNGSSTSVLSLTNIDTRNAGTGVITAINLGSLNGSSQSFTKYDDWYICDMTGTINNDFLGDVRVNTLIPNGDGALTQLTTTFPATPTTHFDKVDDILHDGDATYNEGSVDNAIDLFTLDDLPVFGAPTTIHGIQTQIVAKKLHAGAKSLQERLRVDTTDFTGTSQALSTSYTALLQTREINPVTGVKFTESDINTAIQVGYEVLP